MGAVNTPNAKAIRKVYTSASAADTTTWASPQTMADWVHVVGLGTTIVVDESGNSVTLTTDVLEPALVRPGAWQAFTSTTAGTRVTMGNGGLPPRLVTPAPAALDYAVGAPLTDTATTTVQRAAIKTSFLLAGTMSQGETITLGTVGAVAGDYIKIIRTSTSAQTAAIVNGGGGAGTLHTQLASKVNFTEARFDGANWLLSACGPS